MAKNYYADKEDPNFSFEIFYKRLSNLIDKHVPLKKLSKKQLENKGKPWITRGIKKSIQTKDKLLKQYGREKNESKRKELHRQYKLHSGKLVKLTKQSKTSHYQYFFQNNLKNPENMWKGFDEITNKKKDRNG